MSRENDIDALIDHLDDAMALCQKAEGAGHHYAAQHGRDRHFRRSLRHSRRPAAAQPRRALRRALTEPYSARKRAMVPA